LPILRESAPVNDPFSCPKNSDSVASELRLIRNHGLQGRDIVEKWGVNSRFDNLHAIVGNEVFKTLEQTISTRIHHAHFYDRLLQTSRFDGLVEVPERDRNKKHVFHLYIIKVQKRDALLEHLKHHGVEAKIHYPIPLHLQPAAKPWGLKKGMFPVTECQSDETITLPCHQYLSEEQLTYAVDKMAEFYGV
jgi:dTDP-4-amino-4,6-dideoxygalactose transaminase